MGAELTRKRTSWGVDGRCTDPTIREAYTQDGKLNKRIRDEMRKTCKECPVLRNCRAWAILHSTDYFIAGMMPYEVAAIRSNEIMKWGYEAVKWGWLEEPNLLTKEQLGKLKQQVHDDRRKSRRTPSELPETFEVTDFPDFSM